MKRLFLCFILSALALGGFAQEYGSSEFKKKITKADALVEDGKYLDALPLLEDLYVYDTTNANLNYLLGVCYLIGKKDHDQAIKRLESATKSVSLEYREANWKERNAPGKAYYFLGRAYHFKNRFDRAITNYYNYRSFIEMDDVETYNQVRQQIQYAENAKELIQNPIKVKVTNLGPNINSKYPDYCPVVSADGRVLIFTSRREGGTGDAKDESGNYYDDIYVCDRQPNGWSKPRSIGSNINSSGHEAAIGLSPDGQLLFIYKDDNNDGNIYQSRKTVEGWSSPEPLGSDINTSSWETHASVTAAQDFLVFTSNRSEGGYGGRDLWYCKRLPNGDWGLAQNMGSVINTDFEEDSPFISSDGNTLIFSSQGHTSMGGFDIFKSELVDGVWGNPKNIGYPISSSEDDVFLTMAPDGKTGYYSSSMDGGYGSADLYRIYLESEKTSGLAVARGVMKVPAMDYANIEAKIEVSDEGGAPIGTYRPNQSTGFYVIVLAPGETYTLSYEADGYPPVVRQLPVSNEETYQDYEGVIELDEVIFGEDILALQKETEKLEKEKAEAEALTKEQARLASEAAAKAKAEAQVRADSLALASEKEAERKKAEDLASKEKEEAELALKSEQEKARNAEVARKKQEALARFQAEQELVAKKQAEEAAAIAAEKAAQQKAEAEAAEEAARLKEEQELAAKKQAEEAAAIAAEQAAQQKAEAEAAEEAARLKEEQELAAKKQAEEAAAIAAEKAAQQKAEAEAAEEAARLKEEQELAAKKQAEEAAAIAAEQAAQQKAEAEAAEEAARLKEEQELAAKKQAEEAAAIAAEQAAQQKAEAEAAEEAARLKEEQELAAKKQAEDEAEALAKAKAQREAELNLKQQNLQERIRALKEQQKEQEREAAEFKEVSVQKMETVKQDIAVDASAIVSKRQAMLARIEELKKRKSQVDEQKIVDEQAVVEASKKEQVAVKEKEELQGKADKTKQEIEELERELVVVEGQVVEAEQKVAEAREEVHEAEKKVAEDVAEQERIASDQELEKQQAEEAARQLKELKKLEEQRLEQERLAAEQAEKEQLEEAEKTKRELDQLEALAEQQAQVQAALEMEERKRREIEAADKEAFTEQEILDNATTIEQLRKLNEQLIRDNLDLKKQLIVLNAKLDLLLQQMDYQPEIERVDIPSNATLKSLQEGKRLILRNIFFDYNQATLRSNSRHELNRLYDFMKSNPSVKIEVSGHTDSRGNDDYNLRLSKDRAQAVVDYLIRNGISSSRLSAVGYGETHPIARNENPDLSDNPVGRQLNRRIEISMPGGKVEGVEFEEIEVPEGSKIP